MVCTVRHLSPPPSPTVQRFFRLRAIAESINAEAAALLEKGRPNDADDLYQASVLILTAANRLAIEERDRRGL